MFDLLLLFLILFEDGFTWLLVSAVVTHMFDIIFMKMCRIYTCMKYHFVYKVIMKYEVIVKTALLD